MTVVEIREPIWNARKWGFANQMAIGLNAESLTIDNENAIKVDVLYKNKQGVRKFPHKLQTLKSIVSSSPTMERKGVKLHVVPIHRFQEVK